MLCLSSRHAGGSDLVFSANRFRPIGLWRVTGGGRDRGSACPQFSSRVGTRGVGVHMLVFHVGNEQRAYL